MVGDQNRTASTVVVAVPAGLFFSLALGSCGIEDQESTDSSAAGTLKPVRNSDQMAYQNKWANKNATDAQIDALLRDMPRLVQDWQATVTNVREEGDFTIIETSFLNQNYYLWIFEPDARETARQIYARTDVAFSGEIVQELSFTRTGARENPEFGVYASHVVGGGIELIQTAEGIAQQHELDRRAAEEARAGSAAQSRDSNIERESINLCQEIITKRLEYPVSGEFSWFQGKTRKESDSKWVYTDVVTSITNSGSKRSTRFVCTVRIKNDELSGEVRFLD